MWQAFSSALKQILLKLLKVGGGFKGMLASQAIDLAIEKVIKPIYQYVARKFKRLKKSQEIKKPISKYEESKNEQDFNNNFDDLP